MNTVDVSGAVPEKKAIRRCVSCRNKLSLTDFPCKCGLIHCSKHRLPETHNCTFDFKKNGQEFLSTSLVKVVGIKIDAI
uniref:AN1-type domain-containing protein n=1 Tax=viral metagenome TaxID=1070528 RepID=A0A6C0KXH3_9ZZZZ